MQVSKNCLLMYFPLALSAPLRPRMFEFIKNQVIISGFNVKKDENRCAPKQP